MVWSINDGKLRIKDGITPDLEHSDFVNYICHNCDSSFFVRKSDLDFYTCWFCEESNQLDLFGD